ncbi:MAG TPA: hypothetical protein VJ697_16815 [Nitrososphaeraceae archaeon]|nr:hypothetical protein [Nitrososphaeraceae archaeon]
MKDNNYYYKLTRDNNTPLYNEQSTIPSISFQSELHSKRNNIADLNTNPITILETLENSIINIPTVHSSGDSIKRSLIAQINNAILILQDDDSDNDVLICTSFISKFLSSIKLYERIGLFKSASSETISKNILNLKTSLCTLNNKFKE